MPARIYALDRQQVSDSTEVVEGQILILHCSGKVVIALGATHPCLILTLYAG